MTATVAEALTYDGAVEAHVARSTGTLVVLYDLRNGGDWIAREEDEGGRWMISCDDHSTLLSHTTRALARSWMSAPEQWCEDCRESMHDWQPVETRWGGAYRCSHCGSTEGDPQDGLCPAVTTVTLCSDNDAGTLAP